MRSLALALSLLVATTCAADPAPRLILWAWERPEDLRFLRPQEAEVAFLAATVDARGDEFVVSPRLQPLHVNDGTTLIAVVRVEARGRALDPARASRAADLVATVARRDGLQALQLDFDAAVSQRAFYIALLRELRARLRPAMRLEMTALASWCLFDDWLADLEPGVVDDIVPMIFRMGADAGRVRQGLSEGEPMRCQACRGAIGIATDELIERLPPAPRVHVFHPRPWTRADWDAVAARVRR